MHFQWASVSSESSDTAREQPLTRGLSETSTQVSEPCHDHYLEQRNQSMQTMFALSLRQGCTSDHKTRLNHWWKQTSQRHYEHLTWWPVNTARAVRRFGTWPAISYWTRRTGWWSTAIHKVIGNKWRFFQPKTTWNSTYKENHDDEM